MSNSVSLSNISYSIRKNLDDLSNLVKAPDFAPVWIATLTNGSKKRPKSYTGNFAVTYHFRSKGHGGKVKDFGIRMWHSKVKEDDLKRYRLLNGELEKLNKASPNHIRFAPMVLCEPEEYGFLVKGTRHPCLKMEWQDAENFDVFINNIMRDGKLKFDVKKDLFRQTKQKILELATHLEKHRCSHGDLSSGNIMLSQDKKDGSIKIHVIDFDSFYSQSLSNLQPSSIGHEDWQHPGYISNKLDLFGLRSDYCPLLCLIITLEALATDTNLYDQFAPPSQDGSGILLRKKDLIKPESSPALRAMLDLNNSLLNTYIDDLKTLLDCDSRQKMKRPFSLLMSQQKSRPTVTAMVNKHQPKQKSNKTEKSWNLRKRIESKADLVNALEGGAAQMTIVKAVNNYKFKKRFNDNSMLEFYEIAINHYGGLDSCEDSLQTQYVWALNNAGQKEKANQLANELFTANPSNPDIGFLVFNRLRRQKKWPELFELTSQAIDLTPSNIHVNIFHSTALLNLNKSSVDEAFADSRVRTNDNWRLMCEIIKLCSRFKHIDEDLSIEAFEILMGSLNDEKVLKQISLKPNNPLFSSIVAFLSSATRFKETKLPESILMLNLDAVRLCKRLPPKWSKQLTSDFVENAKNHINDFKSNSISQKNKYNLVKIISNLSIWGLGEADYALSIELQKLIYSFEWETEDGLAVAASFDAKDNDAMIVWINGGWYLSKDRATVWSSRTGNIWIK
tara:strand:+ start:233 stop:2428 length:2196 start_codon:yes stop_codon:yes gene_type:complete